MIQCLEPWTLLIKLTNMRKDSKIYIAGHTGLVGSAILRILKKQGYENILTATREHLDLCDQRAVENFFSRHKPRYVILAAAKVGGIYANSHYPAEFIAQNLNIQSNVIHQAKEHGVERLLFLGSSCIYPKECPQPIKEEYLLTGQLEPTNRSYALAKIAGIEMCRAYNYQYDTKYLAVMPTNLYGPGDNYDLETSHVIPALMRKMYEAKTQNIDEVVIWGTGRPKREFMYSDDLAEACIFLLNLNEKAFRNLLVPENNQGYPLINVGYGEDLSINLLARKIASIVEFYGKIIFDENMPDGTLRKILDVEKIRSLGWSPKISLEEGLRKILLNYSMANNQHEQQKCN